MASFTITGTSPATAVTAVVGTPILNLGQYDEIKIVAALVGATGGALDVYIQWTPDAGATWWDYAHFPQLAASAAAVKYSFDSAFGPTTASAVGTGTTPALAANVCTGGTWGDGLRCVCVGGASTSAGAVVTITISARNKKQ